MVSKVREWAKAGMALATALTGFETLVAALGAVEHPWVHGLAVGLSAVVGGATWLVRNKATVDQVVTALESDPVLEEQVTTVVVEKAIEASPDLVEDLIRQYRDQ
jgi:hypothetical protein